MTTKNNNTTCSTQATTQTTQATPYKTALPFYFTATEASDYLGLADSSYISRLCRENKIFAYKVGTTWLIPDHIVLNTLKDTVKKK